MPKKTKKKKLIAELRRQERIIKKLRQEKAIRPKVQTKVQTKDRSKKKVLKIAKGTFGAKYEPKSSHHAWVISDLKRIILLSLLAFGLEAVVYWAVIINK